MLRDALSHYLERSVIVQRLPCLSLQECRGLATDVPCLTIGDEALRPLAGLDAEPSAAGATRLTRHQQNHRTGIPRRITSTGKRANLPLASDAQRDVARIPLPDVGERDNGDLAFRFIAYFLGYSLDPSLGRRRKNVGKVVDETDRSGK